MREGLLSELQKIAEHKSNKEKLKRWAKNTGIMAAGAGTGAALTMLADKFLAPKISPIWKSIDPTKRKLIAGSILGALGTVPTLISSYRQKEQERRMNE